MPSKNTRRQLEEYRRMIEEVNDVAARLSSWEISFMESITEQFDRWQELSPAQAEKLEQIHVRKVR